MSTKYQEFYSGFNLYSVWIFCLRSVTHLGSFPIHWRSRQYTVVPVSSPCNVNPHLQRKWMYNRGFSSMMLHFSSRTAWATWGGWTTAPLSIQLKTSVNGTWCDARTRSMINILMKHWKENAVILTNFRQWHHWKLLNWLPLVHLMPTSLKWRHLRFGEWGYPIWIPHLSPLGQYRPGAPLTTMD